MSQVFIAYFDDELIKAQNLELDYPSAALFNKRHIYSKYYLLLQKTRDVIATITTVIVKISHQEAGKH